MIRNKFLLFALGAMLALLANAWVSYRSAQTVIVSARWVQHTHEVLQDIERVRGAVTSAEASVRGFVVTGAGAFRDEFRTTEKSLPLYLGALKKSTADNPRQRENIAPLQKDVAARLLLLNHLITLTERGADGADVQHTVLEGLLVSKSIMSTLGDIRAEEMSLLAEREVDAQRARKLAVVAPLTISLIALAIFVSMVLSVGTTLRAERQMRRQLQAAMEHERTAREHAEEADRLKDEFLATLSHELRTPLTAIVGWSSMIAAPETATELTAQGIDAIGRAARMQARLIDDLLDVSRIVTGKMKLAVTAVDLRDAANDAMASVRPSAEAKGIELVSVLTDDAVVLGDIARLQQIVWNLLSNAVKFTPSGGRVQLALRRVNSHVELSVSDNGEGIAVEFLPHVFERFRQQESGVTRSTGGLGLGLSIVKHLVELHGGAVRAESAGRGHGSAFYVELPLAGVRASEAVGVKPAFGTSLIDDFVMPPPPAPVSLEGRTILVVEDDRRTLHMIDAMLIAAGARVLPATNPVDAYALLSSEQVDVILSDIGMPGEDGLSFLRRVRATLPAHAFTAAVALTAFARADDRMAALAAGFSAYLTKPVTREELVASVASVLRFRESGERRRR